MPPYSTGDGRSGLRKVVQRPQRRRLIRRPSSRRVPRPELFVGKEAVAAAMGDNGICTINALLPELHRGESKRYGRAGHIPGSVSLPCAALLDPDTNTFLPPDAAQARFDAVGATPDRKAIVYCGGGIAATLDAFLLYQLGYEDITVYDASMSEWAKDEALPIEVDV